MSTKHCAAMFAALMLAMLVPSGASSQYADNAAKPVGHLLSPSGVDLSHQDRSGHVPIFTILVMTCIMSAMAGFGAVPFFFFGKLKEHWAGIANAVACGVMLAASFDLLHEGAPYSPLLTITGMVVGALFIKTSQEVLSQYEDANFEDLTGADARKAMLIVGVMAAHAFGEGSGVGVSFSGHRGWAQGTLVTIAIGLHNIPEGMAVATVMVARGAAPRKALFWSLFCAFPQALVAVPSFMFVETFQALLPMALGFAAGCMIWIVCAELIPDALAAAPHPQVATAATLSAAWLQGLSMAIAQLEQPDGTLSSPISADVGVVLGWMLPVLPAVLAPCGAAAVASWVLSGTPVALGASVGVTASLGALGLLTVLAQRGAVSLLGLLMCAGLGAGCTLLLWRSFLGGGSGAAAGHEGKLNLESHASDPALSPTARNRLASFSRRQLIEPLELSHGGGMHVEGAPVKSMADHNGWHGSKGPGHVHGTPPGVLPTAVLLGGSSPPASPFLTHYGMHQVNGHSNGGAHFPGECNCAECLQGGHGVALVSAHAASGVNFHADSAFALEDGHICKLQLPGGGHRAFVQAAWFGIAVLLCHEGGSTGLRLARALVSGSSQDGAEAWHLLLPLMLQGVPVGLACLGLGKAVSGAGWRPALAIAGACSGVAALVALCSLLRTPIGNGDGVPAYDAGHITERAGAFAAGTLLTTSIRYLWPAAMANKAKRVQLGATLGAGVTVCVWVVCTGLCAGTPYCLR